MNAPEVWERVAAARVALAGELDGIEAAAWDAPSLCEGWRVRDVVAHLVVLAEGQSPLRLMAKHSRVDLRPNRAVDKLARRLADSAPTHRLTQRLRHARDGRFVVPGMPPIVALGELYVHRADIAGAAALERRVADGTMREVLEAELRLWFAFGVARSMRGYRFVASDADWSVGPVDGPRVEAAGEELLLIATGRRAIP